ncbi:hypothetical protein sos41_24720 [Alphaproteobacteria bacterium SO-S41]|nr:hypothetical protein sos41_24720 [Alphaproteobacteria bacterium SO-S41]
MLVVHHLGVSQSERIVWLCEELGIPYELKNYARDAVTRMGPPDYKALHPLGTAPIITDGAVTLAETGAIMEYILAKYGDDGLMVKPDAPGYADYLFWYHFANGSVMPAEMSAMISNRLLKDQPVGKALMARSDRAFAMTEARLGEVPYLAGQDFTAADIVSVFALTTMRAFTGRTLDDFPNIRAYLARIGARPAYQRAMKKGDPDMAPMLA